MTIDGPERIKTVLSTDPAEIWDLARAEAGCVDNPHALPQTGFSVPNAGAAEVIQESKYVIPWELIGSVLGGCVGLALIVCGVRYLQRLRKKALEDKQKLLEAQREAAIAANVRGKLIKDQCTKARESVWEFQCPMILMHAPDFLKLGQLLPHETCRDKGMLTFVDTYNDAIEVFMRQHFLVFFSHQWLGWHHPDPEGVQYKSMVNALLVLANDPNRKLQMADIYVWVDWFSIPQKCRAVQKLAILSLPVLASTTNAFVAVAPEAKHENTKLTCNQRTYESRCWCRAEIMSHWSRRGTNAMYYAHPEKLEPMAPEGISDAFLEAVDVMGGELTCCRLGHKGGTPCDREELVMPMVGLYSEIYAGREDKTIRPIYEAMEPILDRIFPRTFMYKSEETGELEEPLFGDLISAVRYMIDREKSNTLVGAEFHQFKMAGSDKAGGDKGAHSSPHSEDTLSTQPSVEILMQRMASLKSIDMQAKERGWGIGSLRLGGGSSRSKYLPAMSSRRSGNGKVGPMEVTMDDSEYRAMGD